MPAQRNYVARSPIMRKGGPHIKSKTGQRVRQRLQLGDSLDEWYETNEDNVEEKENGEPEAPHDIFKKFNIYRITTLSLPVSFAS